jgi:hypothetical protein
VGAGAAPSISAAACANSARKTSRFVSSTTAGRSCAAEVVELRGEAKLWCYDVTGPPVGATVTLADQFGSDTVQVEQPEYFCNPVVKVHNGVTTRIQ